MSDLFRDSTAGQLVNYLSRGRLLPYEDQRPGWKLPPKLSTRSSRSSLGDKDETAKDNALEEGLSTYLVDWYDENDQDNPMFVPLNSISTLKPDRVLNQELEPGETSRRLGLDLSPYLQRLHRLCDIVRQLSSPLKKDFSVDLLLDSTPSIPGVMEHFNVSHTQATLGLSLYVIGYGIGPLLFSPLSEIPSIGRNPLYIATLFIFVILQIPTIYAPNISTLLAMRFFAGFVGSPALATGGASLQDMFVLFPIVLLLQINIFNP